MSETFTKIDEDGVLMVTDRQQMFLDRLLDNALEAERRLERAIETRDRYAANGFDTSATSTSSPCSLDFTVAKCTGRLEFARKEAVKYGARVGVTIEFDA